MKNASLGCWLLGFCLLFLACSKEEAVTNPPLNLTLTVISSNQIDLSWTDNSDNEDGFKIERSANNTDNFVEIFSTNGNTENYSDIDVTAGTIYYYRVKSFVNDFDSDFTNVVYATTFTTGQLLVSGNDSGGDIFVIEDNGVNIENATISGQVFAINQRNLSFGGGYANSTFYLDVRNSNTMQTGSVDVTIPYVGPGDSYEFYVDYLLQ